MGVLDAVAPTSTEAAAGESAAEEVDGCAARNLKTSSPGNVFSGSQLL